MYRSIFTTDLFQHQTIIVTGGGSGIGRCVAHELAALGATVLLVGRSQDKLDNVSEEIAAAGGKAYSYPCNIRDEDAVKVLIASIVSQHGRIDGLVNNAGGQFPSPLKNISAKGWEAVLQVVNGGASITPNLAYTAF